MIHLFPRLKKRLAIMAVCFTALVIAFLVLSPGLNPFIYLLIELGMLVFVVISQYLNAAAMHNQMLTRLYSQLDAEGFVREYEPLLKLSAKRPKLALTVCVHLSNAYCALGRFDEAMALLSSVNTDFGKNEEEKLFSRFAVLSNLCYCALQKEDAALAKTYLDEQLAIKAKLEEIQKSKPEKKRMAFFTELNEQCTLLLTTGKADIDVLRELVQSNSQTLHKINISLWVARAYLAVNNRREAETRLEQIVRLAPDLYPGKAAAQLLASLPEKAS